MKKFLKDHGYDTLLALLVLLFGGSIVGLFQDVLAAVGSYPHAVAACCGLSLVGGLFLSALIDRKSIRKAEIEAERSLKAEELAQKERERDRELREAAEAQRAEREASRRLLQLSDAQLDKMLVCYDREMTGRGPLVAYDDDIVCCSLSGMGVFGRYVLMEEPLKSQYVLEPEWRLLIAENEEAIRARVAVFREGRRIRRSKRTKE